MKKLTKESILKTIKSINEDRMNELFKELNKAKRKKDAWGIEYYSKRISEFKPSSTAIKYMPRLQEFKESNGNLRFIPEIMKAYSYQWYELAKIIDGKMILNSYGYSNCTTKHVWSMRSLLKQLNIKYLEIQAPQGLQNLERSMSHHVHSLAREIVKEKYARIKGNNQISFNRKSIKLLQSFGITFNEVILKSNIQLEEENRMKKLANKRYERDQKKQVANIIESPRLDLTSEFPRLKLVSA